MGNAEINGCLDRKAQLFARNVIAAMAKLRGYPKEVPPEVLRDIDRTIDRWQDTYCWGFEYDMGPERVATLIQRKEWNR